jgi:hypothetical protein
MNSIQHSVAMYADSLLRDFVAQQYNNNSLTLSLSRPGLQFIIRRRRRRRHCSQPLTSDQVSDQRLSEVVLTQVLAAVLGPAPLPPRRCWGPPSPGSTARGMWGRVQPRP